MTRVIFKIILFLSVLPGLIFSQSRTGSSEKREPEPRKIELENKSAGVQTNKPLPTIDLPEFVITGIATIDLPDASKLSFTNEPDGRVLTLKPIEVRDRETREFARAVKPGADTASSALRGKAAVSIGTFFSPKASLWIGQNEPQLWYSAEAGYFRTKGFVKSTDRSRGDLSLRGGMKMPSGSFLFDRADISSNVVIGSESYKFYGVQVPFPRDVSRIAFSGSASSPSQLSWLYDAHMTVQNYSVADSSNAATESLIGVALQTVFPFPGTSLHLDGNASFASLGGLAAGTLSYVDLSAGFDRFTWKDFFLSASLHVYGAGGMEGQSLAKFYPNAKLGYQAGPAQLFAVFYNPKAELSRLSEHIAKNPYLSSTSVIRHLSDRYSVGAEWEGFWSEAFRTKVWGQTRSILDYPMYADSSSRRIWNLVYAGTTILTTLRAELFAKFSPNDYFSSTLVVNSSKNSITSEEIPYLPQAEASMVYAHSLLNGLTLSAGLRFLHSRNDNVVNSSSLAGALLLDLKGEYFVLTNLRAFLEIANVTNQRYELWKGYQAFPFTMAVGLGIHW